jgi:hypothetical protein
VFAVRLLFCTARNNCWGKGTGKEKESLLELDKEDSTKFGVDGMEYNSVSFMLILWRFSVRVMKHILTTKQLRSAEQRGVGP